jgi:FtsP/CotA-like multicopper oxidase with cupredoxin domain
VTRLNVYAGLAGAYFLTDPANDPANLPPLVPLVIQDRMFDTNGQLYFPNLGINPEHPYWIPEFVGDTIVVNGEVWPYKNVDRQRYTFLFLNGSNARAYDMSLVDPVSGVKGPRMWVIGTDGGYLDNPVLIDPNSTNKAISKSLVSMPGERYQVIIDFNDPAWISRINTAYAAMGLAVPNPVNVLLKNTAKTPFPGGAPAKANTTGRIVQFRVSTTTPVDTTYNPSTLAALRTPMVRLANPLTGNPAAGVTVDKTRQLTLNEVMGAGGPLEVLVNNTKWTGQSDRTYGHFTAITNSDGTINYYSELPKEGETELWEIVNLTADAHPIHLHLVQFQLMNRQTFDVKGYNAAYNAAFPGGGIDPMTGLPYPAGTYMPGFGPPKNYNALNADGAVGGNPGVAAFLNAKKAPATPPLGYEAGWKDTVIMYPGQVTRILVRWAPTDIAVGGTGGNPATLQYPFDPNGGHGYVWHCHIIDHEDNEMMRPSAVEPRLGAVRTYLLGTDY